MSGLPPLRVVATGHVDLGGGLVVEGVVVEDGTAIFLTSQVQRILGVAKQRDLDRQIKRIPREAGPLSVSPRVVQLDKGGLAYGYTAEDLSKICAAYGAALAVGTLHPKQVPMAQRAVLVLVASSAAGLRAVLYEAAHYQSRTSHREAYEAAHAEVSQLLSEALAALAASNGLVIEQAEAIERAEERVLQAARNGTITDYDRRELTALVARVATELEDLRPTLPRASHVTRTYNAMRGACEWGGSGADVADMPAIHFPQARRYLKSRLREVEREVDELGVRGRARQPRLL